MSSVTEAEVVAANGVETSSPVVNSAVMLTVPLAWYSNSHGSVSDKDNTAGSLLVSEETAANFCGRYWSKARALVPTVLVVVRV